jgi:lauroyl/myristoyl acyltransferase
LIGSLAIAWLLPQRWWPGVARQTSWFGGILMGKTTTAVASRMTRALADDGAMSAGLAADLRGARYEVAFQCLRGYRPGGWTPKITVRGEQHIEDALRRGKGCVLWVAHFVYAPNVVKVGLKERGYRVSHLSRPDHGFSSTQFGIRYLNPVRSAFEDAYLEQRIVFDRAHPAAALKKACSTVARNGIVSFTAGAWEGSSLVEADFLGSRIRLAMGPVWLARRSGAVLLAVFALRTRAPDEFVIEVEGPIDAGAGASEIQSQVEAAHQFLLRHGPHLAAYPGQWRGWSSLQDPIHQG